jgi:hypothetical protein
MLELRVWHSLLLSDIHASRVDIFHWCDPWWNPDVISGGRFCAKFCDRTRRGLFLQASWYRAVMFVSMIADVVVSAIGCAM